VTGEQSGRTLSLHSRARDVIDAELARAPDGVETGGILLGGTLPDLTVEIRHAGGPGPAAVQSPTFFLRDLRHAQDLADTAFHQDGSVWKGEWHTHPTSPPAPSQQDLDTYTTLLADDELDFDEVISIIVGRAPGQSPPAAEPEGWIAAAWSYDGVTLNQLRVRYRDDDDDTDAPRPP
jgi:integrative and conjugative element protein (TIGR02256 family)